MEQQQLLVDRDYRMEKFPGKGGWTYVMLEELVPNQKNKFGWVRVNGHVDGFELKKYKLMSMGKGKLFLPIRAEIRKKIGKQAGDSVRIVLYEDHMPMGIPDEIVACFELEPPVVYQNFLRFTESEQKAYIDWIYEAKQETTKANRILKMMDRLAMNKRLYDI